MENIRSLYSCLHPKCELSVHDKSLCPVINYSFIQLQTTQDAIHVLRVVKVHVESQSPTYRLGKRGHDYQHNMHIYEHL